MSKGVCREMFEVLNLGPYLNAKRYPYRPSSHLTALVSIMAQILKLKP